MKKKSMWQHSTPIHDKNLSEIGREPNILNLAKATDETSTANTILDEIFCKKHIIKTFNGNPEDL